MLPKSTHLGTTGIGFELARVSIQSNNLGEHARTLVHGYLEHRFASNRWDITPGFSVSHYSDQDTFFYPGIDIGFKSMGIRDCFSIQDILIGFQPTPICITMIQQQ